MRSPRLFVYVLMMLSTMIGCEAGKEEPPGEMGGDVGVDMGDVCEGVACGGGGWCAEAGGAARCVCPAGLVADGLRCVSAAGAPALNNLPAAERGAVGQADSFLVMASGAGPLTFSVDDAACPFDITINTAGKLDWTCPATAAACAAVVTVSEQSGLSDIDLLTISCTNGLPAFSSAAPTTATEGQALRYDIACADPEGQPVTLRVAPDDTCGGALEGSAYVWTPGESQGGASCLLRVLCGDAEGQEAQAVMVAVAETNQPPVLSNLPAEAAAQWGRPGGFMAAAADADQPAQALTWSVTTTCSFPVSIDPATGLLGFTCGDAAQTCEASVSVTDGQATAQDVLSIRCANEAPAFTSTMPLSAAEGSRYDYAVSCVDPDGDALTLTLDPASTCPGATLTQVAPGLASVSFTPGELDGGAACSLSLRCHDGSLTSSQAAAISIAEANQPPSLSNLPAAKSALWGHPQLVDVIAQDADLPAQPLSFTVQSSTCSFPITVSQAGRVGFFCGATPESCVATVRVSDGQEVADGVLAITCENNAPSVSAVTITPAVAYRNTPLRCEYMFSDPDNNVDRSRIAWFINNVPAGAGATLSTGYAGGDVVRCEVTPDDGAATQAPVSAQRTISNREPAITDIFINPPQIPQPGTRLSCRYAFSDGDGDPDASVIQWLIRGVPVATGPTFSNHATGDLVSCRVTPYDGVASGAAATSEALLSPVLDLYGDHALATGSNHTCAIKGGGLFCWGNNDYGQLGNNTTIKSHAASPVLDLATDVTAVAAYDGTTCAIQDGALKCWGDNEWRQLGDGTTINRSRPVQVAGMETGVTATGVGRLGSCAVQRGALKCWGLSSTPTQIVGMGSGVTDVVMGYGHSCAIQRGALKCWGGNARGQLGDGTTTYRSEPVQVVGMETGVTAVAVALPSDAITCAIQHGALKCWGHNFQSHYGDGTNTEQRTPRSIPNMETGVTHIALGSYFGCAIQHGALKCWGTANHYGTLGDGQFTDSPTPIQVPGLETGVTAIKSASSNHVCAFHQGTPKCWGYNFYGQVGAPTAGSRVPYPVPGLSAPTLVTTGNEHTCAIDAGALKCWGSDTYGQLGTSLNTPQRPQGIISMSEGVTAASAGAHHTCAITNGKLMCWGRNHKGQLGIGSSQQTYGLPNNVVGSFGRFFTAVSAGAEHTCAVHSGATYCWGNNASGQLGDNSNNQWSTIPVQVYGLINDVTQVAVGAAHSCAIDDGALKCWGANNYGQLGDGTTTNRRIPTQVPGMETEVTSVIAGDHHTCAIRQGVLTCWGYNNLGQLGDGTTLQNTSPSPVAQLTSAVTAASANVHSCAIQGGALKCWGLNSAGQLGDDTQVNALLPKQVVGMTTGVTALDAGLAHTCAIQHGSLYCWGVNTSYVLGMTIYVGSPHTVLLP